MLYRGSRLEIVYLFKFSNNNFKGFVFRQNISVTKGHFKRMLGGAK